MIQDQNHPFLRPLWRRIALVAFCAAWSVYEFVVSGSGLWGTLAGGMAAYGAWQFLINYQPTSDANGDKE